DVTDGAAISRALDVVRKELGPITGVVHGAGVLADKLLSDKTRAQYDAVFDTKVGGLRALLQATDRDPLRFIVLFSSVAGRCGNAGQSDYAMANEVLDKVAAVEARRRNDECVVRAIGWGPWESGMVTPALKAKFAEMGVPLIPLEVGASMMIDELRAGADGDVEIVIGGEPRMEALTAPHTSSNANGNANGVGSANQEREQIVRLDLASYPALDSHRIQGAVVVPAVLAIELMSHAVKQLAGARNIVRLRDVRVVKGIRLATGANPSIDVKLVAKARGDREIVVELRSLEGHLHYAATADLSTNAVATQVPRVEVPSQRGAPWTADDAYERGLLFHGPAFRAISSLDWIGDGGASAMLATSARLGWPASHAMGDWVIDLALLDGGLQLARLWGIHALGKTSLPTKIGEVVVHKKGALPAEVRCVLVPRSRDEYRTVTDLLFVDGVGVPIVELRGVEMHIVPSESPSVLPPSMQAVAE
ncbi:MAG: SDR family NAD(P)-dependent oxidoreductase, partial [Polyangiales bacterium]